MPSETSLLPLPLHSLLGWLALAVLAWLLGGARRPVDVRPLLGGTLLAAASASIVFLVPTARAALVLVNDVVLAVLDASLAGVAFLFGPLAMAPGEKTAAGEASVGFVFATQVLPAIVFFAAVTALLYHLRLIQPLVALFARLFRRTTGLSGAEALGGAASLFVGIEAGLAVRPFIARMTRSELLLLLTCGMSTVASTTLAIYVFLLREQFPLIAGHLLSASLLSVPTAVVVSRLMMPEQERPETAGGVPPSAVQPAARRHRAWLSVLAEGGMDGVRLAVGIAALLIAILGLVALLDLVLARASAPFVEVIGVPLSVERILAWLFTPLAWCLGLESADVTEGARLLGRRVVLTEVVAYQDLARLAAEGAISARSLIVLSYALCGFAHVASIGVFVGGFATLAPERADDLGALGPRALMAATLSTLMTGAAAGVFWTGASVLGAG